MNQEHVWCFLNQNQKRKSANELMGGYVRRKFHDTVDLAAHKTLFFSFLWELKEPAKSNRNHFQVPFSLHLDVCIWSEGE